MDGLPSKLEDPSYWLSGVHSIDKPFSTMFFGNVLFEQNVRTSCSLRSKY